MPSRPQQKKSLKKVILLHLLKTQGTERASRYMCECRVVSSSKQFHIHKRLWGGNKKNRAYIVIKAKLGIVVPVHAMKAYRGSRGRAPLILTISITWRL
jgi:hypothetical protein